MKIVGFMGGGVIHELGPSSDVELFFECISYVEHSTVNQSLNIIVERLYMRYIPIDKNQIALDIMEYIFSLFAKKQTNLFIDWREWSSRKTPSSSWLDPTAPNLAILFGKYLDAFRFCIKSTNSFYNEYKAETYGYDPIRIVRTRFPDYAYDSKRALAEYDCLVGKPFWR